jgi:hypothetical protein
MFQVKKAEKSVFAKQSQKRSIFRLYVICHRLSLTLTQDNPFSEKFWVFQKFKIVELKLKFIKSTKKRKLLNLPFIFPAKWFIIIIISLCLPNIFNFCFFYSKKQVFICLIIPIILIITINLFYYQFFFYCWLFHFK